MNKESVRANILIVVCIISILAAIFIASNLVVYRVGADKTNTPIFYLLPPDRIAVFAPSVLKEILRNSSTTEVLSYFIWTFALSTAVAAAALYAIVRLFLPGKVTQTGDYGSARWATMRDIKDSGLLNGRGIIVGALRYKRKVKLLRYDGEGHAIVACPTRSGKGVTLVVPTALTWQHSVLFNDIKGELWALTSGWRKKHLNSVCLRFDATCEDGTAARWNPLFEIRPYPHDVRDAQNIALTLTTSESSGSRSDNERHWRVMGARLIKATILHQLYAGKDKTLPGCYRMLTSTNRDLEDTLLLMLRTRHDGQLRHGWQDTETGRPTPTHPAIAHVARDMLSKSDRERSAIVSSAISYLEPFDDPIMASNVSESDFSLTDLMQHEHPVSLYLTTPVADLDRVQSLHRLFFTLAGTRNTEQLEFKEGKPAPCYKHPLLEVFDECAHLGYSPMIQKHFSLASGYGIQGMFVFQDFSQLFDLYGRNESITSNCDIKVAFAPNSIETAEYLSRILGTETREKTVHKKPGAFGNKGGEQRQSIPRPLLTPDECLRLSKDKSIILKNGYPPILGDKVPYYEIPALLERSKIPPPPTDRIVQGADRWWERVPVARVVRKDKPPKVAPEAESRKKSIAKGKARKTSAKNTDEQIDMFSELIKRRNKG